ncbi:nucleotide exchange factor GrpE [Weissella viridescens]|uniref:Protein GrpE n=1 Tax=Weissella viridescens TaxID=1629 RepID=A0A0R2H2X7_WEIVI|nr:nucleotide exchange factor GrpE [Weissella viridescens]KRN47103.1 chaperone GrpE protein [Weissella viridescens]QOD85642.1 nucleotide exchange factor GrpE [Weissella viridescens]GEA94660.1 protein GrpE [Weissella viridescens]SUP59379.1 HSP-70 cofactor [Weissella viridescens]
MAEEKQTENQENEATPLNDEEVDVEVIEPEDDVVEVDETATESVADEIADLKQQLSDADDKFLRAQAEMQNMQTRLAKEQAQALKYANQKLGLAVLPALDNLERALQVEADDDASEQLKKGVEMVFGTLKQALSDNGIKEVGQVGETFDPNYAQAIQSVPADDEHPADTIASVMQKGYMLEDRVIRPAMVAVYN